MPSAFTTASPALVRWIGSRLFWLFTASINPKSLRTLKFHLAVDSGIFSLLDITLESLVKVNFSPLHSAYTSRRIIFCFLVKVFNVVFMNRFFQYFNWNSMTSLLLLFLHDFKIEISLEFLRTLNLTVHSEHSLNLQISFSLN